jgi:hypothetical protein
METMLAFTDYVSKCTFESSFMVQFMFKPFSEPEPDQNELNPWFSSGSGNLPELN